MKQEFSVQRYRLRWICAAPFLIAAIIPFLFMDDNALFNDFMVEICASIAVGFIGCIFFLNFDRLKCFSYQGQFWEEYGRIVIRLGRRRYEISDVTELKGEDTMEFLCHYTELLIRTPEKKVRIYGQSLPYRKKFADSDLYPLLQLILERHPELKQKNDRNDESLWYVQEKQD